MTIEEEVLAVGETWDAALVANDAAAFTEFVTDDWAHIDSKGATTRAVLVGWIRTGRLVHHTMRTLGEPRVAIHGDTAIVTARKASSGTWDGVAYTADEWITAVFVREGERWLCALSQKSPVERQPKPESDAGGQSPASGQKSSVRSVAASSTCAGSST